jgi:hypothetical protein
VRGPDQFGYIAADDDTGCNYSFIDLEGQTGGLALTPAPGQDIDDDAHTQLSLQFGQNFDLYGRAPSNSVVMSTNGYISTSPAELGNDTQNVCGLSGPGQGRTVSARASTCCTTTS